MPTRAADLACRLLEGVGDRLAHSKAVVGRVGQVAELLPQDWRGPVSDAAWLHDIGHSPVVADSGLHGLDGARWLRGRGWPESVCRLVAWHSAPLAEAHRRRLTDALMSEFVRPLSLPLAALTWADMTTSPAGELRTVEQRLAEIVGRYPPGSVVYDATVESAGELGAAVGLIERLR